MLGLFKSTKPVRKKPGNERRSGSRRSSIAPAKIRDTNGTWHDCATADLSPTGAKLTIGTRTIMLPRQFEVWIAGGKVRPARMAWRGRDSVGVRFI
jgi:PilZ domain-containing protein